MLARAKILSRQRVAVASLPREWRASPAPSQLAAIGDAFVAGGKAAILIVPAALAPCESNWLLNPGHPEFARVEFPSPESFSYDQRLFR